MTDVCVVKKEAQRNKGGTVKHSKWRNYDDLNEYFWYVSFKIVSFKFLSFYSCMNQLEDANSDLFVTLLLLAGQRTVLN